MPIPIPEHLQSEPWSSLLWSDVLQYLSLLDQHIAPQEDPFFVDVGGNIGFAAVAFHLHYGARVLSIEAIPKTHLSLQKNCAPYRAITTIQTAIGSQEGMLQLYEYPLARGLGGLDEPKSQIWRDLVRAAQQQSTSTFFLWRPVQWFGLVLWSIFAGLIVATRIQLSLPQQPLSNVLNRYPNRHIDLLKIDIEGHELAALRGIKEQDWKRIKTILVELHPKQRPEILTILADHGFQILGEESGPVLSEHAPTVLLAQNTRANPQTEHARTKDSC